MIGPSPDCIRKKCLHYTRPLECSIYKRIPNDILMGEKCEHFKPSMEVLSETH